MRIQIVSIIIAYILKEKKKKLLTILQEVFSKELLAELRLRR